MKIRETSPDPDWYFALNPVRELVLAGDRPNLVMLWRDDRLLTTATFLKDQQAIDGKPTAYLCENFVCNRPVQSTTKLKELLDHH